MAYHYVARSQQPTAVTAAVTAAFTGAGDLNLIVAKTTRLEVFRVTAEGLEAVLDIDMYAEITSLDVYHSDAGRGDWLLLATARAQFRVLAFDPASGELQTKAQGDLRDNVGKPAANGGKAAIAPSRDVVGMYYSENLFKVLPVDLSGRFLDAFNVRLDEGKLIDFCFLHNQAQATLCALFDTGTTAKLKTFSLQPAARDLAAGPWQIDVPRTAHRIHPIEHGSGVLCFTADRVLVCDGTVSHTLPTPGSHVLAAARVDENRILFSQQDGMLSVVVLAAEGGQVTSASIESLGEASIASALVYLDAGLVYVGSRVGDSQLVQLASERDDDSGSYLTVLETFPNLGPIVDMCLVRADGQSQLLTCSGADRDGSVRIVRCGVGIEEQASIELPGIKGMWSMPRAHGDAHHTFLVQAFTAETRVLSIADDEMGETEIAGFDAAARTLHCAAVAGGFFVQVTADAARLVRCADFALAHEWRPGAAASITVAAGNATQLLLALSGGVLVLLTVDGAGGTLVEARRVTLPHEVACLSIEPLGAAAAAAAAAAASGMEEEDEDEEGGGDGAASQHKDTTEAALRAAADEGKALLCAVGLWTDMSVRILRVPSLEECAKEEVGGEVIPRSVLLITLEGTHYAMVGMGDGQVVSAELEVTAGGGEATCAMRGRKAVSVSTGPVALSTFTTHGDRHVFAASDRPAVVYSRGGKLLFSSVNMRGVHVMCPFDSETFPECLALATDEELVIGTVDEVQKLHIRTVALGEAPRRICYLEDADAVAVTTTRTSLAADGNAEEREFVRLFDAATFEELDSLQLEDFELALSVHPVELDGRKLLAITTGFALPGEDEPSRGRILLAAVTRKGTGAAADKGEAAAAAAAGMEEEEEEEEAEAKAKAEAEAEAEAGGGEGAGPLPRKLRIIAERTEAGGCFAARCLHNRLLVGCNTEVLTLQLRARPAEGGAHAASLELLHRAGGHVTCLFMDAVGRHVLVGDVMRAISVLRLAADGSELEEVERDFRTAWTSAVGFLAPGSYLSADMDGNLVCSASNANALSDDDKLRLSIEGEYHLGSIVNSIVRGTLAQQPGLREDPAAAAAAAADADADADAAAAAASDPASAATAAAAAPASAAAGGAGNGSGAAGEGAGGDADGDGEEDGDAAPPGVPNLPESGILPAFLYGAIDGSVGAVFCLSRPQFVTLQRIQRAMRKVTREAHGFVDGDLVERFLELAPAQQKQVVQEINADGVVRSAAEPATVAQVVSYIEDIARMH